MVNLFLIAIACQCVSDRIKDADQMPDIVLISIDSLRADHLGVYGYGRPTSPFLDSLAREGVWFADAKSPSSWTLPSHVTLLSGESPTQHQVVESHLKPSNETIFISKRFQEAGWSTAGFVSALYVSKLYGFNRGFNSFEDYEIWTDQKNLRGEIRAERIVDDALRWWRSQDENPRFLFLHLYDVHYPYSPPSTHSKRFDAVAEPGLPKYRNYFYFKKNPLTRAQFAHKIAQYDECIRYVDDQIKRLHRELTASGRPIRFAITSDHGEEFGERGSWGHAHTLNVEQLRVPLILSGHGIPTIAKSSTSVGLEDIAPTLLNWANLPSKALKGLDLMTLLRDHRVSERSFVAETSRFKTARLSLSKGKHRLDWDLNANQLQLYDLESDPQEISDLSLHEPERTASLYADLLGSLPHYWSVRETGQVLSPTLIKSGVAYRHDLVSVSPGEKFVVFPFDSEIRFWNQGGSVSGSFSVMDLFDDRDHLPFLYRGYRLGKRTTPTSDQRTRLKNLGYIEDED